MKRIVALLCALLVLGFAVPAFAAGNYVITNPYQDVVWEGMGKWGAYKGNLHTHTTFSDGSMDIESVVEEYYKQGYDVLASTDHGVVSKSWDQKPMTVPVLGLYRAFNSREVLSGARLEEIIEGADRGSRGMVQVPQGNEMNAAVVYKNHVVGLFGGWGQGWWGLDNDYRTPIAGTEKCGGLSFIAHPGDWIKSSGDMKIAQDPANVNFFADILRDYPSCLGIEIYNLRDTVTRMDRVLWDQLLMRLMPEGRQVWGFSNDDSHALDDIGSTAEILFMPANNVDHIRKCLETGAFLACSRRDRIVLGDQYVGDYSKPFPSITNIQIAGNTITLETADADKVEWIADGEVIGAGESIDLKKHASEITCYVRAQLTGPGGIAQTQAFGVDKGDGYKHPDDSLKGWELFKWNVKLYLTKNPIAWLIENAEKLFK